MTRQVTEVGEWGVVEVLESRPWSTTGGETVRMVCNFWALSVALKSAEGFKSGGQVMAGSCHVSLQSGGIGGHSVVGERDFDKYEFKYTVKTNSTSELSLKHPKSSIRKDLASAAQRGALCPRQVLS